MKFLSWNVNGLRAALNKGALGFLRESGADVICMQETKARPEQVGLDVPGYTPFWNSAEKKGYSGTVVLTKIAPEAVFYDMNMPGHDSEGRVITAEFRDFYLVNVYTPNARRGLTRLTYRMQWDADFLQFLKQLEQKKPVIFCGDLNVAHREIDLANPKTNVKNAGFTPEERQGFGNLLEAGFIDTFREFCSEGGHYTWWSYMFNARAKNIGWRIDYFCISAALRPRLQSAAILPEVMGSDHCPVVMHLAD